MSRSEDRARSAPRPDGRLVPVAVSCWVASWIATSGAGWAAAAGWSLGIVVVLLACLLKRPLVVAVAVVVPVVLVLAGVRQHQLAASPVGALAHDRAIAEVELVITTDPQPIRGGFGGERLMFRASLTGVTARGQAYRTRQPVQVFASAGRGGDPRELLVGTRIRAPARLGAAAPDEPVVALVTLRGPVTVVAPPGPSLRAVESVRAGLREAMSDSPPSQRALVPALVLGDTSAMDTELEDEFRTTGLTHLTAVSGANLTLLLAFLLTLARWAGIRGRGLPAVGLFGVILFVGLCRTEPSVLRAAAMGLVALAALSGNARSAKGVRHLAVAVTGLLLVDPWLSRSIGFVLSVFASAGIILLSGPWRDRMGRWAPLPLAEAVTVPLAAQLATQPVVTAISGQVSLVGLLANALAGPFVGPATVLGFGAAGLSVVAPPLAAFLGWAAGWCAQLIIWIARVGGAFPGAAWQWPATPVGVAVVTLACGAGMLVFGQLLASRRLSMLLAAVLVVAVSRPQSVPGWPPPDWLVVACDVGQGTATILRVAEAQAVVVDTGPEPGSLERCLSQLGVTRVPLLVLSHYHADHIDGRSAVLGKRPVGAVLVSPLDSPAQTAERVRREAVAAGAPVVQSWPGQQFTVGSVRWRTLGPVAVPARPATGGEGESSAENDASIVAIAEVAGVRVLLTGDVEPAGQLAAVGTGGGRNAAVLAVPHHGSGRQDDTFISDAGPGIALVSVGADNDYGHPSAKTLRLLGRSGRQIVRTDLQGSLVVAGSEHNLRLVTQRSA